MGVADLIGAFLDATPIIRRVWRWLVERQMEVSVGPPAWRDGRETEMNLQVAVEEADEGEISWRPWIYAHFALKLTNHRTDRKERIIGAWLAIKKRRLLAWHHTIVKVSIHERGERELVGPGISDIELQPISAPAEIQCVVSETIDESIRQDLPQNSEIWLILDMVGPVRRLERKLQDLHRRKKRAESDHKGNGGTVNDSRLP